MARKVRILNRRNDDAKVALSDDGARYVGRPTKWGNPYAHKPSAYDHTVTIVATREDAVEKYHDWIMSTDARAVALRAEARRELRGRDLVCWCAPKLCHAELLSMIANSKDDKELGL